MSECTWILKGIRFPLFCLTGEWNVSMKKKILIVVTVLNLLFIASCGGGGGGSESDSDNDGGGGTVIPQATEFVVFAWNDLGMHCLNPTYDTAVILPPYNTFWTQVVKRGNPPEIVTSGITVEYEIINNTYSDGKRDYGQFWDYDAVLFGVDLVPDTGLNLVDPGIHNSLSGQMVLNGDHFQVDGIPLTPVDDSLIWNPYQVADITVRDSGGAVIAQTRTTVPTSDEINCSRCHGGNAFLDTLLKHDANNGTGLVGQIPVLCANCHGSPVLGTNGPGTSGKYLSEAIHEFHASRGASCYDCHPGATTQCSRSIAHTAADGNCIACHGQMSTVAGEITSGQRIPWEEEPKCSDCHAGVSQVDTGTTLYRNAKGHGGLYCESCHGSPHAMIPTSEDSDNYQAVQYQSKAKTIGSCGVCHASSRGNEGEINEFPEEHGGANPERRTACHVCHTEVSSQKALWPHAYQWRAR